MTADTEWPFASPGHVALLRSFLPRPIRVDDEHQRAIGVVNSLLDRASHTSDEEDYLELLGLQIADYEDSVYGHPVISPVERLRHLVVEHGLTQAELSRRTGVPVTSLSEILLSKRRMSPTVRAKLAKCFGVSASFFS